MSKSKSPAPQIPPQPVNASIRIGTAGWSIPRASAEDFPGPGPHLARYSRLLACAEINATFYRSPRTSTYARWATAIPHGFRFSVKAPKAITHEAALACGTGPLRTFLDEAAQLGDALGPILLQLPPKLAFNPSVAGTFFGNLRDLYSGPAVLEPRHATWFDPEADQLLKQFHIARAAADPALSRTAATPGGSGDLVYFRLHGSPRTYYSSYTPDRLGALADEISAHARQSPEVWCIFDNTASGAAAGNAVDLHRMLTQPFHG